MENNRNFARNIRQDLEWYRDTNLWGGRHWPPVCRKNCIM